MAAETTPSHTGTTCIAHKGDATNLLDWATLGAVPSRPAHRAATDTSIRIACPFAVAAVSSCTVGRRAQAGTAEAPEPGWAVVGCAEAIHVGQVTAVPTHNVCIVSANRVAARADAISADPAAVAFLSVLCGACQGAIAHTGATLMAGGALRAPGPCPVAVRGVSVAGAASGALEAGAVAATGSLLGGTSAQIVTQGAPVAQVANAAARARETLVTVTMAARWAVGGTARAVLPTATQCAGTRGWVVGPAGATDTNSHVVALPFPTHGGAIVGQGAAVLAEASSKTEMATTGARASDPITTASNPAASHGSCITAVATTRHTRGAVEVRGTLVAAASRTSRPVVHAGTSAIAIGAIVAGAMAAAADKGLARIGAWADGGAGNTVVGLLAQGAVFP